MCVMMMIGRKGKNSSYLSVCRELRANLWLYSDDMGCLLPELTLREKLGASRNSVRKALEELRTGGYISTIKRRNYVKQRWESKEIGILADCFKSAPYLPDTSIMVTLLNEMEACGVHGRLLVPSDVKNVAYLAEQYKLKGLIWFNPPENTHGELLEINKKIKISCIFNLGEISKESPLKKNYVAMDKDSLGGTKADYFLKNGHKKVVFVSAADRVYQAFRAKMAASGAKQLLKWHIDSPTAIMEYIPYLVKQERMTAIASVGGGLMEALFDSLAKIEKIDEIDLDLILPDTPLVYKLMRKYPRIKVSRLIDLAMKNYGVEAIRLLMRQIEEGKDQQPILVKPRFI